MKHLIDKLYETHNLDKDEFIYLLENYDKEASDLLFKDAFHTVQGQIPIDIDLKRLAGASFDQYLAGIPMEETAFGSSSSLAVKAEDSG